MFKSMIPRAVIPVTVAVTGFVVMGCLLLYSMIRQDLVASTILREANLAETVIKATHYAMLTDDRESLGHTIDSIGSRQGVEHVRIFNKKGLIMFSSDPAERHQLVDKQAAGCAECHDQPTPPTDLGPMEQARRFVNSRGAEVLAITAPIVNQPGCSTADCHAHPPEQSILGTLDIGVSEKPLKTTLATLGMRMSVFCLMVLVLTIGGVCALLRRSVFLPLKQLTAYAEDVEKGHLGAPPPEGSDELRRISRVLQTLGARTVQAAARPPAEKNGSAAGRSEIPTGD